ncbi:MAG: ATP-binding cassette domain-containing protein [Rhizomicrobium sp.]
MLVVEKITVRIAGRDILKNASATVPAGRRIGLVGRNGAGKSTLLKTVLGQIVPDDGQVSWPRDWRIGALAQEAPTGEQSLVETVLAADTERVALLAAAETETDPTRIGDIHARLEAISAYAAPARAAAILSGLGFSAADQARACREFSGGWRMRVALAALLFTAPDLLLLDEPTNYLDLEGVLWLENFLKSYRGTVLIVSHDRDLLNACAEFILHLEGGGLTLYGGNYDTFVTTRAEKRAGDIAFAKKQEAQRAHLQAFVDRFRAKATKARQAQSRMKMLEKMEIVDVPVDDTVTPIRLPQAAQPAPPLIVMEQVAVGYDSRPVLTHLNLRFDPDERVALLGKNGNGKSTLAKLLAGKLPPLAGSLTFARKTVAGYFAQHQLEELNGAITPVQTLAHLRPLLTEQELRNRLGGFGFSADKANTHIAKLSGGERARLMLALATLDSPNLLILDEPTNHLDIDTRSELLKALAEFSGAVVLVSHDRYLLEGTVDRLLLVDGGTVTPFDGDLDDYRRFLLTPDSAGSGREAAKQSKEDARKLAAEKRRQLKPLKDKIDKAEKTIASLNAEIARLDGELAKPDAFTRDVAKATQMAKRRADAAKTLEDIETDWLMAQEEYEAAMAG